MTTQALDIPGIQVREGTPHAVRLLQVFALTLMLLPADYVIKPIGADGYAAAVIAYVMFVLWLAATLFGQHDSLGCRYPVRIVLAGLWVASLVSYLFMNRAVLNATQLMAADRWLMQLAGISGIVLVAAEFLHSVEDIRRVLRALTWGGAVTGVIAILQFKAKIDLTKYLHLPGFSLNAIDAINTGIGARGSVARVAGTATDPIELGVVAAMMLPLAAYLLMHDTDRPKWKRWVPLLGISLGIPASVSRSGIIAVVVAMGILIVSLPPTRRLKGLAAVPVALAAAFVTTHGLIGTLANFFMAGNSDSSIAHRTNNYPYFFQQLQLSLLHGAGGGTYIPLSQINILDNEYLTISLELGILGLLAFIFFLVWPAAAALVARKSAGSQDLRDLCAALAGAEFAAVICSGTFDSFSFPMFYSVQALVVGLIGAVWMIARQDRKTPFQDNGEN